MARHDLNEILLEQGAPRIRLRRGLAAAPAALHVPQLPTAPVMTVSTPPAAPAKVLHEIKSPTVGTFYKAEKPDAEPFVKVGSRVTPSTVVCKVEAMKLFTGIGAEG